VGTWGRPRSTTFKRFQKGEVGGKEEDWGGLSKQYDAWRTLRSPVREERDEAVNKGAGVRMAFFDWSSETRYRRDDGEARSSSKGYRLLLHRGRAKLGDAEEQKEEAV